MRPMRLMCPRRYLQSDWTGCVKSTRPLTNPMRLRVCRSMFIPLAERSGLIKLLTYWLIDRAARQIHSNRERHLNLPAAVNLSARNIEDPQFFERLNGACATWGIRPEQVQIEITEGDLLQDTKRCVEVFTRLSHARRSNLPIISVLR